MKLLFLLCLFWALTNVAHASPDTIIILDASGSMWGKIQNKTKMAIAKDTLSSILSENTNNNYPGLMLYGHRDKGSCSDIELVFSPQAKTQKTIESHLANISPKGKTPIGDAVLQAANALNYKTNKASIILISDGIETCGMDPCLISEKLEQSAIDFTVHVIGFDTSKLNTEGLECIARNTGGIYASANNTEELRNALLTSVAPRTPMLLKSPTNAAAGSKINVEWQGDMQLEDRIRIYSKPLKKRLSIAQPKKTTQTVTLLAPDKPDDYFIQYIDENSQVLAEKKFTSINVKAVINAPERVNANQPFTVEWSGPANTTDRIRVFFNNQPTDIRDSLIAEVPTVNLVAPETEGTYEVRYLTKDNVILASDTFAVNAASASLSSPQKVNAGSELSVKWSGPASVGDRIRTYSIEGIALNSIAIPDPSSDTVTLRAPEEAGDYKIKYILSSGKTLAETSFISLPVTAILHSKTEAHSGDFFVIEWQGPANVGDRIKLYNQTSPTKQSSIPQPGEKTVTLKAPDTQGLYQIKYVTSKGKVLASIDIQIK